MKKIEQIEQAIAEMKVDMEKVEAGNHSAGTRVRNKCQEIKKLCGEIRTNVQELRAAKKD